MLPERVVQQSSHHLITMQLGTKAVVQQHYQSLGAPILNSETFRQICGREIKISVAINAAKEQLSKLILQKQLLLQREEKVEAQAEQDYYSRNLDELHGDSSLSAEEIMAIDQDDSINSLIEQLQALDEQIKAQAEELKRLQQQLTEFRQKLNRDLSENGEKIDDVNNRIQHLMEQQQRLVISDQGRFQRAEGMDDAAFCASVIEQSQQARAEPLTPEEQQLLDQISEWQKANDSLNKLHLQKDELQSARDMLLDDGKSTIDKMSEDVDRSISKLKNTIAQKEKVVDKLLSKLGPSAREKAQTVMDAQATQHQQDHGPGQSHSSPRPGQ